MKRALLAVVTTILLGVAASDCLGEDDTCAPSLAQARKTSLTQNYAQFDQTPGEGWRRLAEQESCFAEAGNLIDLYLTGRSDLRDSQKVNLSFHAGQVYAFAGKNDEALKRFRGAIVNLAAEPEFKWSEYVLATIAFLEHDADSLVKYRNIIEDAASYSPNASNLQIVDLLIKNFDRPYRDALRRAR
jgi:hypothetical protein